jgi:hypothetical protein
LENYQTEDFRRLLQVNRFEDTIWFNKEAFESALLYVPLFLALESPAAFEKAKSRKTPEQRLNEAQWHKRIKGISDLAAAFQAAEQQSEYRLEGLLEALSIKSDKKKTFPVKNRTPSRKGGSKG